MILFNRVKGNKTYPEIRVNVDGDIQGNISVFLYSGWDSPGPIKDISTGEKAEEIATLVEAAPDLLRESQWALSVLTNRENDLNDDEKEVLKALRYAIEIATNKPLK